VAGAIAAAGAPLVRAAAVAVAAPGGAPAPFSATGAAVGVTVLVWPARLVTVAVLVLLSITTVLWTLAKITLFGGGAT
jgi:hypothetical protein